MSPNKPSEAEDIYIMQVEFERKRQRLEAEHEKLKKEELARLKKLHHMCCPKCGMELVAMHYKDVEVDRCSHCEGIWLDNGELDCILSKGKGVVDKFFSIFQGPDEAVKPVRK